MKKKSPASSGKRKIKPNDDQFDSPKELQEPEAIYATNKKKKIVDEEIVVGVRRSLQLMGIQSGASIKGVFNEVDFIEVIRNGVQKEAMENLMGITGISSSEMAALIRTSDRNLRRYGSHEKLNPEQSERIIELARLYSRGEEVFGSLVAFKEWMDSTVMALGNKKPKTFLDTSLGIDLLMNELGRIEHGIFA